MTKQIARWMSTRNMEMSHRNIRLNENINLKTVYTIIFKCFYHMKYTERHIAIIISNNFFSFSLLPEITSNYFLSHSLSFFNDKRLAYNAKIYFTLYVVVRN